MNIAPAVVAAFATVAPLSAPAPAPVAPAQFPSSPSIGLPTTPVPAGPTAEGNEVVMFGDSIFANPTDPVVASQLLLNREEVREIPGMKELITDEQLDAMRECLQGEMTVANELAKVSGRTVHNYGCAAATGAIDQAKYRDFAEQIDLALAEGNLDENTTDVLVQFGFNDYRHDEFKTAEGNQTFIDNMNAQIERVKAAAPNATVKLVSYPTLSDENDQLCPVRIVAGNPVPYRMPYAGVTTGEDLSQARLIGLSEQAGIPLIDLKAATKDRHSCASDSERWIAGIIDVPVPHSLFMHLTDQGVVGTAALINEDLNAD
ncbi:GDSL-type esterase/lipase family protein [Corynebacterium sp. H113]|uniref:GDSL-type esterase/lipase family protein n=1 Tax=Corynebacterium sp. H113 TaxID=3133419 RepID=UPI00309F54DB